MRTFRIVAHNGLAVSRDVFYEQAYRLPDDLEASGWFIPEKSKITTEFRDMLATSMSQAHTFDAKSAVDAASLVFAHSALDAIATELCDLIAEIAPYDWEDGIFNRKVSLTELRTMSSYEEVFKSVLCSYMQEVAKKSLLQRIKLINQKCQPVPEWSFRRAAEPYTLDEDAVEALDKRRQDIVHRLELRTMHPDIETDLTYLEATCLYLSNMVGYRYKLALDVSAIQRAAMKALEK